MKNHYLNPKCESRIVPGAYHFGVFANAMIVKGEIICVWGGKVACKDELDDVTEYQRTHAVEVEEGILLVPNEPGEDADFFNHSCSPNAGFRGQITLIAITNIMPGDQVTFDYAMCDSTPYDEFDCRCGSSECRGRVSADDWKDPKLQSKYAGYFSPYLQEKIDDLTATSDL